MLVYEFEKDLLEAPSACGVVEQLKTYSFYQDEFETLDAYMEWFARNLWKFRGLGININGSSLNCRCQAFLAELENNNIIRPVQ